MRIATYNHMFGADGRSLHGSVVAHVLHRMKRYDQLENRTDISRTLRTVLEANPDILGITEVFGEKQRLILQDALCGLGFKSFHVGQGHGFGQTYEGHVETMVATRAPSDTIFSPSFSTPSQLGFGGGVIGVHVPQKHLFVIQVHLPLESTQTHDTHVLYLESIFREIERIRREHLNPNIILMGDFNSEFPQLLYKFPQLSEFVKLSSYDPTCSMTNILRWFYAKNIDHVLGLGVGTLPRETGLIKGASDHALAWVEVGRS